MPDTQKLGDAPGLGHAASWCKWGIAVEYLADTANTMCFHVLQEREKIGTSQVRIIIDPHVCFNKGTN